MRSEISYLWCLRLDLTGTSEGTVNFTHDCELTIVGEWEKFVVVERRLRQESGSGEVEVLRCQRLVPALTV